MASDLDPSSLSSRYDPSGLEAPLYQGWIDRGAFHVPADAADRPYVIVIPPPNVTAALHMGHALNNTIQDVLIRWRRMQGLDAVWVPGTDHAGIATQNVVERQLQAEGRTRFDLGREAFVDRVWEWVEEYGDRIVRQLQAIGCSCDWARTRFTLDEGLSRAVREVFVGLYEKDLIYRGRYIINWCPRCGTALSNEESEHREHQGKLYRIRYPLAGGDDGGLEVATTRPETMLGDTALAVHPDDDRYREYVGRTAILPLVGRELPIVADEYVDPEFGSGVVKITPAHDPNDFDLARRHDLPAVDVMNDDATMSDAAPPAYRGLDRFDARTRVVEDLRAGGALTGTEDHVHTVGHCYRCDTVVEPRLSLQWFVRMEPLARPALAAYRGGDLRFHPPRYGRVYEHWMENIRDWCISRQLWWGHRIPVWYCRSDGCEAVTASRVDLDVCPECGGEVEQDPDVLDTWFSSWLWPFSTLGWPDRTPDLDAFYPGDSLVTGPDILFFWVARMVMAGCEFMDGIPFTDVALHGTVRDHKGRRMSKSLGNGIDPLAVVELYGADAMRFTLVRGSPLGTDIQLNHEDLEEAFRPGRNFANKIWNAARFALGYLEDAGAEGAAAPVAEGSAVTLADRWILARLDQTASEVTAALEDFRFHEAAELLHGYIWGDFCDWYLELVKTRLAEGAASAERRAALDTLRTAMDGWLRLLHPIMPFITETLHRRLAGDPDGTLVHGPWPAPDPSPDSEALERMASVQDFVGAVRGLRGEYRVDPGRPIRVLLSPDPVLAAALEAEEEGVLRLAGIERLERGDMPSDVPGAHAVLRSGAEVFVPLEGVIDLERERERLAEERDSTADYLRRTRAKLDNDGFTANAPEEVVARERDRAESLEEQLRRLDVRVRSLAGI